MAYNKLILQGNLTKSNELKWLSSGTAIVKNSIAVTEKYKTKDGQQKEETLFLDFTIFRGAEVFNQYTQKGSKVLLDGKLSLETWTAQDGTNRQKHSLKVESFTFLDSKQDSQGQQNQQSNNYQPQGQHYQQPVQDQQGIEYPDDDSIPFAPLKNTHSI